jgi:uncharacterized protein
MAATADWPALLLVLAGALAGGFVNGLTSFGTGLTAMPLWLQVLDPVLAAQASAAASVTGHASMLPRLAPAIDWRRMAPMVVAGVAGVPIGTWILPWISVWAFKLMIGAALVAFSTFMLVAAGRVRLSSGGPMAEAAVGFAGGILGGLAGLPGPLPTVWAALKGWPRDERRAVFLAFNMTILAAMLAASLLRGLLSWGFAATVAVAIPGTLIGARLGAMLYRRLDDRRFDHLVLLLLMLSGLGLLRSAY